MNRQQHESEAVHQGGSRVRSRWWIAGLAGVTGLALTAVGVVATPAADAVGRAVTSAGDRLRDSDRPPAHGHRTTRGDGTHGDNSKGVQSRGRASDGIPVPCDADSLITAINQANARGGAVLDLAKDCTYVLTFDIDGAGLPSITTPITLNGGKNTTIKRAAAVAPFRIVTVDVGGSLTLNYVKITGGRVADDSSNGGGILVNPGGSANINHSKIVSNIASIGGGGGIANLGITTIKKSIVNDNTAQLQGGGIYNTGLLTIKKSHVKANNGPSGGGGVANVGGTVQITHSTISGNQGIQGAGLFITGSGIGIVSDTRVTDNTATIFGGGIYLSGQLTMRKVVLATNTALGSGGGGLFVSQGSTSTIVDSLVKENSATSQIGFGGGIFNNAATTLFGTKVVGNIANLGGGLYNESSGTLTLYDTTVTSNAALTDGGGIFNVAGGTVTLNTATGTTVAGNQPNNCVDVPSCAG
ncbi:right-handed parallel beta-helix repeat-containing protein [Salinispora arenicola]|uniref:right-handed parallel beta-helix repeat-containing protein n=1 Tax=Salinispora arenicola TaxID=168697 RepID=UPI0014769444|nr:right-handed parallel beta-helix repeat-containing protein [Salinispora arenicola]